MYRPLGTIYLEPSLAMTTGNTTVGARHRARPWEDLEGKTRQTGNNNNKPMR